VHVQFPSGPELVSPAFSQNSDDEGSLEFIDRVRVQHATVEHFPYESFERIFHTSFNGFPSRLTKMRPKKIILNRCDLGVDIGQKLKGLRHWLCSSHQLSARKPIAWMHAPSQPLM
jgi:hypothetical protein